jgi:hypothetical protein
MAIGPRPGVRLVPTRRIGLRIVCGRRRPAAEHLRGLEHQIVKPAGGRFRKISASVRRCLGGHTDLQYLEVFRSSYYADVSLSDWLTHTPPAMVAQTLNIDKAEIAKFPNDRPLVMPE